MAQVDSYCFDSADWKISQARATERIHYTITRDSGFLLIVVCCQQPKLQALLSSVLIAAQGVVAVPLDNLSAVNAIDTLSSSYWLLSDHRHEDVAQAGITASEQRAMTIAGLTNNLVAYQVPTKSSYERPPSWLATVDYIVSTSGSTDHPKWIGVTSGSWQATVTSFARLLALTTEDTIACVTRCGFDPSILEVMLPQYSPANICCLSPDIKLRPDAFRSAIVDHRITVLQLTPTLALSLFQQHPSLLEPTSPLRHVIVGGAAFPATQLARLVHSSCAITFYNAYGLTEMSIWQTVQVIPPGELSTLGHCLGMPLDDTAISLADTSLPALQPQTTQCSPCDGVLKVTSSTRICYVLGKDVLPKTSHEVNTGDVVHVEWQHCCDGLYHPVISYNGRLDTQIKRHGVRVSLDQLASNFLFAHPQLSEATIVQGALQYSLAQYPGSHHIFTLDTPSAVEPLLILAYRRPKTCQALSNKGILAHLSLKGLVDAVIAIELEDWPVNANGKVVKAELARLFQRQNSETVAEVLNQFGFSLEDLGCSFSQLGGTSVRALGLAAQLSPLLPQASVGQLVELLLSPQPLKALVDAAESGQALAARPSPNSGVTKERLDDVQQPFATVIPFVAQHDVAQGVDGLSMIRRGNVVGSIETPCDDLQCLIQACRPATGGLKGWCSAMGRCLDASGLVVEQARAGRAVVFIGSHSGLFGAVDAACGDCLWQVQLPGRVEADVSLSRGGETLVVGTYDGYVYLLSPLGNRRQTVKTGDIVRSTAAMMPNWFAIGSHDGLLHVCTLGHDARVENRVTYNPSNQQVIPVPVSATPELLGPSAQLASPCIEAATGMCCNATLSGLVFAVVVTGIKDNQATILSLWHQPLEEPVFASPLLHQGSFIIATAKGQVCALATTNGQLLWRVQLLGGVFAAGAIGPTMEADRSTIPAAQRSKRHSSLWVSSNRSELAHIDVDDGTLLTTTTLPGSSSSTPWIDRCGVLVTTMTGQLCHLRHGTTTLDILTTIGEPIFSSPVQWRSLAFFGARDDSLHAVVRAHDT